MGANWIDTALRLLYVIAITRYLGPELYGIWAYALASYGFAVALAGFGFETLVPIRLGAERRDVHHFVSVTLTLRLGLTAVAACGLIAYALMAEPDESARLALLLVVPGLCGRSLSLWARTLFVGYERLGRYVRMAAIVRLAELGCGVALLASDGGLISILVLHSVAWMVEAAISMRMVQTRLIPFRLGFDADESLRMLRRGAAVGVATWSTHWLAAGPLLLFRHVGGDLASVGQLGLALQITTLMVASAHPFLTAALPVLSRSSARSDPRVDSYGWMTAVAALSAFGIAAAIGFSFGPTVMSWAFGPEFALAGELVGPCLLVGAAIVLPTGYGQVLVLRGRLQPGVAAGAFGGLVLVLTMAPAVAAWGVYGAVVAAGVAWVARAALIFGAGIRYRTERQVIT